MIWLVILGVPVLFAAWIATFMRWRLGIWMLLAYLPFAGAVVLWMSPNPAPLLFKDFLFVIPAYLSLGLLHLRDLGGARVPLAVTVALAAMTAIVLLQMFNPNLSNVMVALVGAKVWLLYLPMVYLGAAALRTHADLAAALRLMTVVAVIPFVIGVVQFAMASAIGPQEAIEAFYGAAASDATQGFNQFEYGAGLYRIPSTFSYVVQYSMFTLSMVAIAYALGRVDAGRGWRLFGHAMMLFAIAASLLSGARANFVFVPLLIALIYVADARVSGGLAALSLFPGLILLVLWLAGLDPLTIFGATNKLFGSYGSNLVLRDLADTLQHYPMGQGTGTTTGAARHIMSELELRQFAPYEGYYAKAIAELGVPGLVLLVVLFAVVLLHGLRALLACRGRTRSVAAAFVSLMIVLELDSFKGYHLDLDPVNVYFWLFAGMLFKLPYLAREPAMDGSVAQRLRRGDGSIRWSSRAHPRA